MATLTLHHELIGARASFQRLRDAKILHGWIESIDGPIVKVRAPVNSALAPGDRFAFRSACLAGDVAFEATMRGSVGDDVSALISLASKGSSVLDLEEQTLVFEVDGRVATMPATGDPRYQCLDATLTFEEEGVETSVRDISPGGVGVLSPAPVTRGVSTQVSVFTSAGKVDAQVEVRYCRRLPGTESYRIGLKILALDRVNRARWNALFTRG